MGAWLEKEEVRQIIIEQAGELAIDGEARLDGKYYMVYLNDDLICGGYINKSELEVRLIVI